jgi:hypothetical protein
MFCTHQHHLHLQAYHLHLLLQLLLKSQLNKVEEMATLHLHALVILTLIAKLQMQMSLKVCLKLL